MVVNMSINTLFRFSTIIIIVSLIIFFVCKLHKFLKVNSKMSEKIEINSEAIDIEPGLQTEKIVNSNSLENNKNDNRFILLIVFFICILVGISFVFPIQSSGGNKITSIQIWSSVIMLLLVFIPLVLLGLLKELVILKNKGIKRIRDFFLELLILIISIIIAFFIVISFINLTCKSSECEISIFFFIISLIPFTISYIIIYGIGITFSKNLFWLRILTFITSFYLMLNIFNNM